MVLRLQLLTKGECQQEHDTVMADVQLLWKEKKIQLTNNNYDKLQTLQKALIQGAKITHSLMPLWQKMNVPVFKPELDQTTSDCLPVAGCPKYH